MMQVLLYTCLALLGTYDVTKMSASWNFNENSVLCEIVYGVHFCLEKIYPALETIYC